MFTPWVVWKRHLSDENGCVHSKEETEYKKIETIKLSMGILNLISLHLGNFLGNISEFELFSNF